MWWAYAELGRRIGIDVLGGLDPSTATDDDVLALSLATARCDLDQLREAGRRGQPVVTDDIVFGWVHERVLGTRRWQLAPTALVDQLATLASPAPLALVPQRQLRHQNTQHRGLGDAPLLQLHPDDAQEAGIEPGADVVVASAAGRVTVTAVVTDSIVAGAVSIPHGWDAPNVNELMSDISVDPLTGMPYLSGTAVTVDPALPRAADAAASGPPD